MRAADAARWSVVTDNRAERGQEIERRAKALAIFTEREFERMTAEVDRKVSRATIGKALRGEASPATYDRLEGALDIFEDRTEPEVPSSPRLIRATIEGVYGAKAVTFEGTREDEDLIVSMVNRVLRGEKFEGGEGDPPHPSE